jgi:hypothetical protein
MDGISCGFEKPWLILADVVFTSAGFIIAHHLCPALVAKKLAYGKIT